MIPDLLKLLMDKKHMKNAQNWLLLILALSFWSYHKLVIKPLMDKLDSVNRRSWRIARAVNLSDISDRGER